MNRKHPRHTGVYQRCTNTCPADRCRAHKWAWAVELPIAGGQRQRLGRGGYDSPKEAADGRAEALHRHRHGTLPTMDTARLTLADWLPRWLAERAVAGDLRETTAATYEQLIRTYLLPKLGHHRLTELRGTHITAAYRELTKLSPATVARVHAVLSGSLRSAMKDDLITRNPAANARLPRRERHQVRPWTPDELGRFLDATEGERLYPLYVLAAFTGLRRGELLGLRWEDVDLDDGRLTVRRTRVVLSYEVRVRDGGKTDAAARVVWLDSATVAVLRRLRRRQLQERLAMGGGYQDGGWLFTWEDGRPVHPEYVTKGFNRLARRHGLPPAKLHSLRHFRAASLISTGADIAVVAKLMGHASVRVTADVYGSLFEQQGREISEQAAGLVPRARRVS